MWYTTSVVRGSLDRLTDQGAPAIGAEIAALRAHNEQLASEREQLSGELEKLAGERDRFRALYLGQLETIARLEHGLLAGPHRERFEGDPSQLTLELIATLLGQQQAAAAAPEAAREVRPHTRRPPTGRRPAPEDLPCVEIEILPDEVRREGSDAFVRIGADTSVVVERRTACFVAVRVVRPRFVRREQVDAAPRVVVAEPAELPIPRGIAGPGFLADSIVRRWQDHLPLHRLEGIYAREGFEIARSTLCGWHEELAGLARPLVDAMWQDALTRPVLHTDATGVLVQDRQRCQKAHFFVVLAPERHVLFRFTRKHDGAAVDRMLADYRGYLVADAHSVFDHLYGEGRVVEVACWAHCRRYFFKSLGSEPERAREALAMIGRLFEIERDTKGLSATQRHAVRQAQSRPCAGAFFTWCEQRAPELLEGAPIARAVRYALNHRTAFLRFLEDGRLPLHNNDSERALRREAVGRRNWLFVGSDQGAEANATFVSLLASCQLHGLEPWGYLRDLFILLPGWKRSRVLELAPASFQHTLEHGEAQQRLAANPFRKIVLDRTD